MIPFLNRFGGAILWPATYGRPIDGWIETSRACNKDQLIPGTKISQGLGRYIYLWCMLNDQVKIKDRPWCWLSNWLLLLPRCGLGFFFLGMLLDKNRISQRLQIYSKARGEFFTSSSEKMSRVPTENNVIVKNIKIQTGICTIYFSVDFCHLLQVVSRLSRKDISLICRRQTDIPTRDGGV